LAYATITEINDYLKGVQTALPRNFILWNTDKNKRTLLELGYDKKLVGQELSSMVNLDYSEGPSQDKDSLNEYWVFGKIIQGKEIYIKIKMVNRNNQGEEVDTLVCMSFHFSEKCLNYPYKEL
jgi:cyclophilin family peptidyl-prolyl cis-trans isomerase